MLYKTWKNHIRHYRLLAQENSGVTTLEFALIAPVFLLMLFGIFEFSFIMYASALMEGAVASASRYGKTGYTATGSTRSQQIIAEVTAKTAGFFDPTKIMITTTIYPSFDSVDQPEPYTDSNHNGVYDPGETYTDVNGNGQWDADMGAAGLGNANDVVVYTISYPWQVFTPIVGHFIGDQITISGRTVVKNEPF